MADPCVERLSTGAWSPERFRRHLEATGSPLVERVSADEVEVTFVDEPTPGTTVTLAVVIGPRIGFNPVEPRFTPVAGTPFSVLTLRMRSDLRFAYVFRRGGPTGIDEQVADPFNPPPRFSECSVARFSGASVAALPDAEPMPWLDAAEARPAPAVESAVLGTDRPGTDRPGTGRRIWISMPPGAVPAGSALPLVVHLDGTPEHSAPSIRDALAGAGLIRPCVVVLVEQPAPERDAELLCNPLFSQMLAEELLPWLRGHLGARGVTLSNDPGDVAIAGESFGGLCALWTALHHPESFGQAIIQSPSCGYHPDLRWGSGAGELLRRTPVPTLIADVLARDPAPIRIFHDAGELEGSSTHSRWLDHALTTQGYDTVYREFAGGHDYAWWRGLLAEALQWCFPLEASPGPSGQDGTSSRSRAV